MYRLLLKLLTPLYLLEYGDFKIKLEASFMVAMVVAPLTWLGNMLAALWLGYSPLFTQDLEFVRVLAMCLVLDLLMGVWKHLKLHTFDFKECYTGFLTKVFISIVGMLLFNALSSINELEQLPAINGYLLLVGKIMNIVYLGGSALSSMYVVSGSKFPPVAFMKRLKKFNNTLNVTDLVSDGEQSKK